ncbi:MAG: hypothetical protein H7318_05020 [Oligoflexus sp.]|nr:hypothetical protein [Oligoflexus sp.]
METTDAERGPIAEEQASHQETRLNSNISSAEMRLLENLIASKGRELYSSMPERQRPNQVYHVTGSMKRMVKARFAGARSAGTFKEIKVADFEASLSFVESIDSELLDITRSFKNEDNSLRELRQLLIRLGM